MARHDPVLSYNFVVEIDSLQVAGFSEVSGLQAEIEVEEYREGGVNGFTHKFAGPVKYSSNLTLKKGVTNNKELWTWFRQIMQGTIERKKVSVLLLNSEREESRRWTLRHAYPVKWTGPDMRANASEVAIETLELAHNGFLHKE
jgi:phage tail-like protein